MREIKKIQVSDHVAVALRDLKRGEQVLDNLTVLDDIPFGHKIALEDIPKGRAVIKYGQPIGCAARIIRRGEHVHSHNLVTGLSGLKEYTYEPVKQNEAAASDSRQFFWGYQREDGRAGIRNEIWIVPTVGCVNKLAENLAARANREYPGITDGFFAFPHNMGCSQLGEDLLRTQKILSGLVHHPNAGGVLVLSLGCENNNLNSFREVLGEFPCGRVEFLTAQEAEDEYEEGLKKLEKLARTAANDKRVRMGADKLTVGFKCGGSDGFSGITANPLCGRINDRIVSQGGTTFLTEVPEMFGAEQLLMNRAVSETVFRQTVKLINGYKQYFQKYGQVIYENPSPGNKEGGITTLEEKSLGCVQKGGQAAVSGVLDYGERPEGPGLYLLNGPGNDQISCTNLAASGAQMILFTTGRGNPFGSAVPTVKISSNHMLSQRKPHWIDFDAGRMLDEEAGQTEEAFFSYLLQVASGEIRTRNEEREFREISIFRDGVIM